MFFFARTTFQIDQTSSTATGGPIFRSQRKNQSVSTFRHNLCSSTEMEILLCGTKDVGDLTLLRLTTSYRGEFTDEHRIVQVSLSFVLEDRYIELCYGLRILLYTGGVLWSVEWCIR